MNQSLLASSIVILLLMACEMRENQSLPAYCPVPTKKEMPMHPDILKRANFSGTVQLSALIDEKGQVIDVQVVKSIPVVDSACVAAAKQWKFTPGRLSDQKGKYVNAKFWFPITFDWTI